MTAEEIDDSEGDEVNVRYDNNRTRDKTRQPNLFRNDYPRNDNQNDEEHDQDTDVDSHRIPQASFPFNRSLHPNESPSIIRPRLTLHSTSFPSQKVYEQEANRMIESTNALLRSHGYGTRQTEQTCHAKDSTTKQDSKTSPNYQHNRFSANRLSEETLSNMSMEKILVNAGIERKQSSESRVIANSNESRNDAESRLPRKGLFDVTRKRNRTTADIGNAKRRKGGNGQIVMPNDFPTQPTTALEMHVSTHAHPRVQQYCDSRLIPKTANHNAYDWNSNAQFNNYPQPQNSSNDLQIPIAQQEGYLTASVPPIVNTQFRIQPYRPLPCYSSVDHADIDRMEQQTMSDKTTISQRFDLTGLPVPNEVIRTEHPLKLLIRNVKRPNFKFRDTNPSNVSSVNKTNQEFENSNSSQSGGQWDALLEVSNIAFSQNSSHEPSEQKILREDSPIPTIEALNQEVGNVEKADSAEESEHSIYQGSSSPLSSLGDLGYDSDDLFLVDQRSRAKAKLNPTVLKNTRGKAQLIPKPKKKKQYHSKKSTPRRNSTRIRDSTVSTIPDIIFSRDASFQPVATTGRILGRLRNGKEFTSGGISWPK